MKRVFLLVAVILLAAAPATVAKRALDVSPHQLKFGKQPFGSTTTKTITITNRTSEALFVSVEQVFVPDTFSPGQPESTCTLTEPRLLGPGETCTHVVTFFADPAPAFAGRQEGALRITARDEAGTVVHSQIVKMSGRGV
jgi:hypothetical protein